MEFDPSLNGLIGAVELTCGESDGTTLMKNLFDGGTLNGNRVTGLLLPAVVVSTWWDSEKKKS